MSADDDALLGQAKDFARQVFSRLKESPDPDRPVSELTRHQLAVYLALVVGQDDSALPVRADGMDAAQEYHQDLRSHLARRYVRNGSEEPRCMTRTNPACGFRCFREGLDWRQASLQECAAPIVDENDTWMGSDNSSPWDHYCDRVRKQNSDAIQNHLCSTAYPRTPSGWGLAVLQRWNSFTPALAASEGGGYFVFEGERLNDDVASAPNGAVRTGVVVDPGYGFVKNFLSEHFGVPDVTAVVVTHDHPDHLADFQAIVNLLLELSKGRGRQVAKKRKIDALLSTDAYEHLKPIVVGTAPVFRDTAVLSLDERAPYRSSVDSGGVNVTAHLALHDNGSFHLKGDGTDSLGVSIRPRGDDPAFALGFPSDTQYRDDIAAAYSDCGVVCLHLGGFTPDPSKLGPFRLADYFLDLKTDWQVLAKKSHLYLPGVLWFLNDLCRSAEESDDQKLVVLSEFGEELSRGLRLLISRNFDEHALAMSRGRVRVVPGDVGLLIDPVDRSIRCSACRQFYPWTTSFDYEVYGDAEQIFYVCPTCQDNLSDYQKASIFHQHQSPTARLVGG